MPAKRIALAAPIRPGASSGNSVTANRWARQFELLGHTVEIVSVDELATRTSLAPTADLVIALHARRCASAVAAAKSERPERPVVVALAGTDLYRDLPDDPDARQSLDAADQLVVLQDDGLDHLDSMDPAWRAKAAVVHQSVAETDRVHSPSSGELVVLVLGHLRDVKDPLLAAKAARALPDKSRIKVVLAGSAHTSEWEQRALDEVAANPRFEWLGEVDADRAADLLASASMLACTSLLEGGANVVSEAIAMGVPVIGTDIGGNRGLLGTDHPGLVPVRDVAAMTALLERIEANPDQLAELATRSRDRQWMVDPAHERAQWVSIL